MFSLEQLSLDGVIFGGLGGPEKLTSSNLFSVDYDLTCLLVKAYVYYIVQGISLNNLLPALIIITYEESCFMLMFLL